MEARKWNRKKHSRMINADEIHEDVLERDLGSDVDVIFIYITEHRSQKVDVDRLEGLMTGPYVLVGVLGEHVGEEAIALAAKMHMRIALEGTTYSVNTRAFRELDGSSLLMGIEPTVMIQEGEREIKDSDELKEMRFVSQVFPDMEHEDFKEWERDVFGNKTHSQIVAIKKCYDSYRGSTRNTKDRGLLAMEEGRHFCSLAMGIYNRSRESEKR